MAGKKTISLKLLLDNDSKKVIFAEAGNDFVDLLFAFLEQPLGSIVRLLAEQGMAESWTFSKVYESMKNLQPEQTKDKLLHPTRPNSNAGANPLMQELGYPRMAMYMISDDLTVKPGSPLSSISFLNALGINDIGSLQVKNVEIDMRKALELVKTSFESTTVLTDVFVGKPSS